MRAQLDFWGPIPKIPLLCPVRLRSKSGPKTVSPPIQIPIVPNRCADGDPPDIGSRVADFLQPDFRGFGLPTSTELPLYVQVAVPMRLPDAGRLVGTYPARRDMRRADAE